MTEVDRLKADPYAFYARKMLALMALDPVDADPSAAWRGSAVHAVLEAWMKEDDCDPARLRARAEALLQAQDAHPLMRALWQPRLTEAIDFIADRAEANRAEGRRPLAAEIKGQDASSARSRCPARPTGSTGSPTAASPSSTTRPAARRAARRCRRAIRCSSACSA